MAGRCSWSSLYAAEPFRVHYFVALKAVHKDALIICDTDASRILHHNDSVQSVSSQRRRTFQACRESYPCLIESYVIANGADLPRHTASRAKCLQHFQRGVP